jgi:hypothetical protein
MLQQAKSDITTAITQLVVQVVSKVHDSTALVTEIASLINYVKDIFLKREVVKQRKLWEEDRQRKIAEIIAKAMKQWDDENYSRLLEAT